MVSENLCQNRIYRCWPLRVIKCCLFLQFIVLWMLWWSQTRWLMNSATAWSKSLARHILRLCIVRGRNLEGWHIGCRPWGVGDDGRIGDLLEKTQCERDDISQTRRIYFSNRRWTNQNPWRRSGTENIHLGTASSNSRRVILTFLENQKGLFHNLTTHFRMPVKLWTTFDPCQETSKTAITLNPESHFTRREKNHSLFH